MTDTTEPIPVIALEYHQDDEHASWLAVVRLLCVLTIFGSGIGAVVSGINAWNYLGPTYRTAYARSGYGAGWLIYIAIMQMLSALLHTLLVIGAAGSLRRIDVFRRITVAACWGRPALVLLSTVGTAGLYASRGLFLAILPTVISNDLSGSMLLAIAVAVILNRPEVRRAFVARGGSITP